MQVQWVFLWYARTMFFEERYRTLEAKNCEPPLTILIVTSGHLAENDDAFTVPVLLHALSIMHNVPRNVISTAS